jgi:CelD/BcsL family acetyltransferase involved in cellulose biosynthesis
MKTEERTIEFIQDSNSPRCDFLIAHDDRAALSCIIGHLARETATTGYLCRLSNIPADSWTANALSCCAREHRMLAGTLPGLRSPVIPIEGGWDAFIETKSLRFKKTVRYCMNKAQRMGKLEYREITNTGEFPGLIDALSDISRRSWKKVRAGDLARSAENKRFFEKLTDAASSRGWLSVWLLSLAEGAKPVAYEYHLRYKDQEYALRADFDMRYAQFSPGSALEAHIIRQVLTNGHIHVYDLCGNDYAYKMRWTDRIRAHATIELYPRTGRAKLLFFIRHRLKPLARRLGVAKLKRILFARKGE